jgi:hypothetical protein
MKIQTDITMTSNFLDAALLYAARGFQVFPCFSVVDGRCTCRRLDCPSPGKHPDTIDGFKSATADIERIEKWGSKWERCNIGIRTGQPSGFFAIDCDIKPGVNGRAEIDELENKHGLLPPTLEAQTGSFGRHLLFIMPKDQSIPSRAEVGGLPGVDVRGDGGYIVAPPSRHQSGRQSLQRLADVPL